MRELALADELLVFAELQVEAPLAAPLVAEDLLPLLLGARSLLQEGRLEYRLVERGAEEVGF